LIAKQCGCVVMGSTVEFYCQSLFGTEEVDYVRTNTVLAAELLALELIALKVTP